MKQHVSNPADATANLHVGGAIIRPGETRYVEVPAAAGRDSAPEAAPDPVADLAKGKVDDAVTAFDDLSDEDLARLRELESEGKNRSTLLEAIDAELLDRASADPESGGGEPGKPGEGGD